MGETSPATRRQFGKYGDFQSETCKTNEDLLSTLHTNADELRAACYWPDAV